MKNVLKILARKNRINRDSKKKLAIILYVIRVGGNASEIIRF